MTTHDPVIFFDGVCNLCNGSVQFVIRHDKNGLFKFASLQSDFAASFFRENGYTIQSDSIILYTNGKFYDRSAAVLRIARRLHFPVNAASIFFIVPAFLRDPVYGFIAAHRYKWFGRKDSCMVPDPALRNRFLG